MSNSESLEKQLKRLILLCQDKAGELKDVDPNSVPLNDRMAHFVHITDGAGETYVQVGYDAKRRIQEWCFAYLSRRGWTNLISVSQCAKQVEEEITFRFFKMKKVVNDGSISKIINWLDVSVRRQII